MTVKFDVVFRAMNTSTVCLKFSSESKFDCWTSCIINYLRMQPLLIVLLAPTKLLIMYQNVIGSTSNIRATDPKNSSIKKKTLLSANLSKRPIGASPFTQEDKYVWYLHWLSCWSKKDYKSRVEGDVGSIDRRSKITRVTEGVRRGSSEEHVDFSAWALSDELLT